MTDPLVDRLWVCKGCGHVIGAGLDYCPECRHLEDEEADERDDSPYCDCGAIPAQDEVDCNRCDCCGKRIDL